MTPDELAAACTEIDSPEAYAELVNRAMEATAAMDPRTAARRIDSIDPRRQARALIHAAVHGPGPPVAALESALLSEEPELISAAALCVTRQCSEDTELHRRLLLGTSPWEPSELSGDVRYLLIRVMGYSGQRGFAEVLWEALRSHSHFCPPASTAEALEALGFQVDPERFPHDRSVSVDVGSDRQILISEDPRFSGYSTCPMCRHFPCRINRFYRGAIQDCSLHDGEDPEELGPIRDLRRGAGAAP